ncbi:hypothetical protein HMI54_015280 [Coelomomyces lativittatus]|nr:hypothetical protein HMI56_003431 [Coelomomyces lativittatus]KAJ1513028.1 hypothetical protein HMI54_015280 [Coelomomyces lativittatus]KAJ1517119.1 hypothetical protein HMI55_000584 [Coelomomyces lativittatus]
MLAQVMVVEVSTEQHQVVEGTETDTGLDGIVTDTSNVLNQGVGLKTFPNAHAHMTPHVHNTHIDRSWGRPTTQHCIPLHGDMHDLASIIRSSHNLDRLNDVAGSVTTLRLNLNDSLSLHGLRPSRI